VSLVSGGKILIVAKIREFGWEAAGNAKGINVWYVTSLAFEAIKQIFTKLVLLERRARTF